ncbi:MAG: transcription antitermination factor NusB [bacterium]
MGARRKAREMVLQGLYTADLLNGWEQDPDELLIEEPGSAQSLPFARSLLEGVLQNRSDLDRRIEDCASHWKLQRMNIVDRNILRLGAFELLHRDDIPTRVSINEAVELAKVYGDRETAAFLNGVLDRIARTVRG